LPSEIDTAPEFEKAMRALGVYETETIHIDINPSIAAGTEDTLVLRPALPAGPEQGNAVVLYQDESGGLSWHFAVQEPTAASTHTRPGLRAFTVTPRFVIPLRTNPSRHAMASSGSSSRLRGPITKWGRKIFKVLVMPIAADLLSGPLLTLVSTAERRNRVDRIWRLTPASYTQSPRVEDEFHDWAWLNGKRSLLVIHGIFSSVEGMLASMPRSAMETLLSKYQGRVLAYNHLSVSKTPEENAIYFLQAAKQAFGDGEFEFDILAHSRGGIVARTLCERGPQLFRGNCNFHERPIS
jgi:hypothetical protein